MQQEWYCVVGNSQQVDGISCFLTAILVAITGICDYLHWHILCNVKCLRWHTPSLHESLSHTSLGAFRVPDSKVHGANMGPVWGRQDPGGPHVDPWTLWSGMVLCLFCLLKCAQALTSPPTLILRLDSRTASINLEVRLGTKLDYFYCQCG